MKRLPQDVLKEFAGKFLSKATSGRLNGVWMDYAIETTENKTLKGQGGIIGRTLKGPASPGTLVFGTTYCSQVLRDYRK